MAQQRHRPHRRRHPLRRHAAHVVAQHGGRGADERIDSCPHRRAGGMRVCGAEEGWGPSQWRRKWWGMQVHQRPWGRQERRRRAARTTTTGDPRRQAPRQCAGAVIAAACAGAAGPATNPTLHTITRRRQRIRATTPKSAAAGMPPPSRSRRLWHSAPRVRLWTERRGARPAASMGRCWWRKIPRAGLLGQGPVRWRRDPCGRQEPRRADVGARGQHAKHV